PFRPPAPSPAGIGLLAGAARDAASQALRGAGAALPRSPARLPERMAEGLASAVSMRDLVPLLRPVPAGPLNLPVGPRLRVEPVSLSLETAKAIKNSLGGTV